MERSTTRPASAAWVPDVVLLDIGLPGMSGLELARRLRSRADGKHPFIVAVTGYGTDNDRKSSAEAGIDMHLVKPVDPGAMTELLKWVRGCPDRDLYVPARGPVRVCAWCGRRLPTARGETLSRRPARTCTHGTCPACFDAASVTPNEEVSTSQPRIAPAPSQDRRD